MASNPEFVQYIADQLTPAGQVTYHKMFGGYGVYLDGKMFALVCDDQLFIKITKEGAALAPQLPKAPPYDGAKLEFMGAKQILDWGTQILLSIRLPEIQIFCTVPLVQSLFHHFHETLTP